MWWVERVQPCRNSPSLYSVAKVLVVCQINFLKLFVRAEPVSETLTCRHTDALISLTEFLHSFHAHAGIHAHLVSSNQDESIGLHSYQASIWLDNTEKWHKVLKKYTCMHIASQFRLIADLFAQILSQSLSHDADNTRPRVFWRLLAIKANHSNAFLYRLSSLPMIDVLLHSILKKFYCNAQSYVEALISASAIGIYMKAHKFLWTLHPKLHPTDL